MCQYSNLKVGSTVKLTRVGECICDGCGSNIDHIGSVRDAVYVGHVISSRYGVCDRFNYKKPLVCLSCGEENEWALVPCESGFGGFGLKEREKVEVERESHSTRH